MQNAQKFIRLLFIALIVFFINLLPSDKLLGKGLIGLLSGVFAGGIFAGGLVYVFDKALKEMRLRTFNTLILGLFVGFLMGKALGLTFQTFLELSKSSLPSPATEIIHICLLLIGLYLGTTLTLRSSDQFYLSIPFVKFSSVSQKKKDFILDASTLMDARIIDLAATGLLDHNLILPRFIVKELYLQLETSDEITKARAKRATDVLKKLQSHTDLELRFTETDFSESMDATTKIIRLARLLDANILTADISRVQMPPIEGVKIINIHTLSNALKPLMQTGEEIKIKVQRYGKEPRQGVGYLEDGTMVVVNGGGGFIGEIIDAQVLSVKHTSSGRMIFCNAKDEQAPAHFGAEYE